MASQHTVNNIFRDQFLFEAGVSKSKILFQHKVWDKNELITSEIFAGDKKGNLKIYYPTLNGYLERHFDKGQPKESYRTRLLHPYYDKNGSLVKYLTVGKNCIFFPPEMLNAYNKKIEIPILTIVEGEKKAFVGCKFGFDCVGISGIWNYAEKSHEGDEHVQGGLIPSLKEFIKVCQVKKVVLMHDSDALDMSKSKSKSATQRPMDFYRSVKRCMELIIQEGCQFLYTYINPHLETEKLGLDDLLLKHEDYAQKVLLDFYTSVSENKFTVFFCTTQIQYLKDSFIKGIFQLNDPEDFYKYHKKEFAGIDEFRFENRVFKINHTDESIEEKKITGRESIWITDGHYYGYTQNGQPKCISNFTMNVLFLLKSHTNPKRIVEFKNVLGQQFIKELTMDDFVSVSSFRKRLIGDGSFIYKGDMFELLNLTEILFKEEKNATELVSLGWQKTHKFFAFSNGITHGGRFFTVDEFGIVNFHENRFYLPAFSNLFTDADEAFENERNFKHIVNEVTFEDWAERFYKTYKNNGAIGICFGVAVLFRDIIYGEFKEFPLLNMFGQKGSGKSTMAKSLMYLFGIPQSAISLENASSTKKGIYRKFSQFRNAIVWLDEYKNSVHPDVIGLLKNLYDGIGYERAQTSQDNRTHSSPVLSSTIISGQDMPTIDPALFTRVILLMFKNNAFEEQDQLNYNALKAFEKAGITNVTVYLLGHRDLIESNFMPAFKKWFEKFSEKFKYDDIPDRLLKNAAMAITPVSIFVDHQVIKLPFSIDDLFLKFVDVLKQHKSLLNDNQEISVFWEIVEILFDEGVLSFELGDFRFMGDTIAVRFNRVFSAYSEKYRRMHGRNGLDKLTLINYLKNSPAFVEVAKSIRFETGNTSGYVFKYKDLGINLQRNSKNLNQSETGNAESVESALKSAESNNDFDNLPY